MSGQEDAKKTDDMKSLVERHIENATYYTIKNATTPAVVTDPKTDIIYAVYFRSENGRGNIYLYLVDLYDKKGRERSF